MSPSPRKQKKNENEPTILDKTVEKMSHSQSINFFLTSSLYHVLPSALPLEAMLLCALKQPWSLDICRKQHWPGGRGIWYRKSVVVEIVLLHLIVCMEGYKFSSSFVQDCRLKFFILKSNLTCNIQCIRELEALLSIIGLIVVSY